MNPNKKVVEKKLEKRERGIFPLITSYPKSFTHFQTFLEFNVYVRGANAERVTD